VLIGAGSNYARGVSADYLNEDADEEAEEIYGLPEEPNE